MLFPTIALSVALTAPALATTLAIAASSPRRLVTQHRRTTIVLVSVRCGTASSPYVSSRERQPGVPMARLGLQHPDGTRHHSIHGITTIEGGTGRFAHARGQLQVEGTANLVTSEAHLTLGGWIAYGASDSAAP